MLFPLPHCNYYGRLHGPLLGDNIGILCVDEAYKRLLEKHELLLAQSQEKLIKEFKKSFKDDINEFTNQVKRLADNLKLIFESIDEIKKIKIIKEELDKKAEKMSNKCKTKVSGL